MPFNSSAARCFAEVISEGLTNTGPPRAVSKDLGFAMTELTTWSLRLGARPSQNWVLLNTALRTVSTLRPPSCELWSAEDERPSAPPMPMMWHVLQLMLWLSDSLGSK